MPKTCVNVSVGAGFENDRRDLGLMAAKSLAALNGPKYLIFECLAERTLALMADANDPGARVVHACSFLEPCIDECVKHGVKIISNFGGPDPLTVAAGVALFLKERGIPGKVMAVTGDALPIAAGDNSVIARNAYIGACGIVDALAAGADIVVTGRVADPTLVVGPVVHELNLDWQDWNALANATLAGHLIECGTQVCGGYYADEASEVPGMANIGPPVATISADQIVLTKPLGGGVLNTATVTQQMLYEMHNPAAYLTPDVTLDITAVSLLERSSGHVQGESHVNEIVVSGAKGLARPATLKSLVCKRTGWFGEAEISYYGSTASYRAGMACDILDQRINKSDLELSFDCLHGHLQGDPVVRVRLAVRGTNRMQVTHALNELDALYVNGPAAGGGVRRSVTAMVETEAEFVSRDEVSVKAQMSA